MRRKWGKGLSILLSGAMLAGNLAMQPLNVAAATGTEITEEQMQQLLAGSGDAAATSRTRISVHDPSIIKDNGTYYLFGTFMGTAKSTDLKNWTRVFNEQDTNSTMLGDAAGNVISSEEAFKSNAYTGKVKTTYNGTATEVEVDFGTYDADAWLADNAVTSNMWAPDIIYNPTMGKYCMYFSLNGATWNSAIVLLTSDKIEGPYCYQGPVVYSGFSKAGTTQDFHDTDLELVLGELDELPAEYQQISDESNGNWGTWWPHAIDPAVFYDEDGKLWMVYGSWSGGICMLELDENTGLRDYTVTYEDNTASLGKNYTSDAYFGKRVAGGYYVSGEGSYIEKIGDYYYLFISYGFYDPTGGYNMRIFRSENPDGPYVDSEGNSALFTSYVHNYSDKDTRGEKIIGNYKWDSMSMAEVGQGHNSAFVDDDGKAYVFYHTKFADGTAGHEVRVHQLFVNEDGWLVAAPYEYDGESLSATGYTASEVAGEYDIIVHEYVQDYANLAYETPKQITLNADGTITGAYSGTWSNKTATPDVTLTIDGVDYKGKLLEQKVDYQNYSSLCFTVAGEQGLCIWGTKVQGEQEVIADNVKNFDFGVPERTWESITLPTTGNSGATITWTSSNSAVLAANGTKYEVTEDTLVTLTATIAKGSYYYNMEFPVMVMAGDGIMNERTLLAAYYENDPQELSGKADGSLWVANPFYQGTSKGLDITGGVSIEFDVTKTGNLDVLGTILGFTGGGKLYFTPGSYLGYNATGGYYDANLKSYTLVQDYLGDSAHVELRFLQTGFEVLVNDVLAYNQEILTTENGAATLTDHANVLKWLNKSADRLNFGYGAWWDTAVANCEISNVECYVEPYAEPTVKDTPIIYYEKDQVVLDSDSSYTEEANPFYGTEPNALYMEYTVNFADTAAFNGWDGIFSFFNSTTGGRISMQANPYLCYNDAAGTWMDINHPDGAGATKWAPTAVAGQDYRIGMLVTNDIVRITVDGEEIVHSVGSSSSAVTNGSLLNYLVQCDKLTWGVGEAVSSYWNTEICTVKDVVFSNYANVALIESDWVNLATNDTIVAQENPFQNKELIRVDMDYTLNFTDGTAKNGWDGIFSFFNTVTAGRISMQTNPYLCYNNASGAYLDANQPGVSGGTSWATSAATGTDYRVHVSVSSTGITASIDGEELLLSEASSGATAADVLAYFAECDVFTWGVGQGETSYWYTELATLSNVQIKAAYKQEIAVTPGIVQLEDGSWQILKNSGIEYMDNSLYGKELDKVRISYDVTFADNAVKNGWDGLFSFYNPDTNGRVSVQSAPFVSFNDWAGNWADINKPDLEGSTNKAPETAAGVSQHVDIIITEDELTIAVDGEEFTPVQSNSGTYEGYAPVLECISGCPKFTIGVGLAETSFWNSELCTISKLEIVENEPDEDVTDGDAGKEDGDDTGEEDGSGDDTGVDDGSGDDTGVDDGNGDDTDVDDGNSDDTGVDDGNTGDVETPDVTDGDAETPDVSDGDAEEPGDEEPGTGDDTPGTEEPGAGDDTPGTEEPGAGDDTPGTEEPGTGDDTPGTEEPDEDNDTPQVSVAPDNGAAVAPIRVDWAQVARSLNELIHAAVQAGEDSVLNVLTGEDIIVPLNIINMLAGRETTLAVHTGRGVTFSLTGTEVAREAQNRDMNLTVRVGEIAVPEAVIVQRMAGAVESREISIRNQNLFGMNVNMHLNLGRENAGRYANLYRFNSITGQLEYHGSFLITEIGQAMFGLSRGGEYLVTVTVERPDEIAVGDYVVVAGDTLSKIASRNRMRLADLLEANPEITNRDRIYPGQRIRIR